MSIASCMDSALYSPVSGSGGGDGTFLGDSFFFFFFFFPAVASPAGLGAWTFAGGANVSSTGSIVSALYDSPLPASPDEGGTLSAASAGLALPPLFFRFGVCWRRFVVFLPSVFAPPPLPSTFPDAPRDGNPFEESRRPSAIFGFAGLLGAFFFPPPPRFFRPPVEFGPPAFWLAAVSLIVARTLACAHNPHRFLNSPQILAHRRPSDARPLPPSLPSLPPFPPSFPSPQVPKSPSPQVPKLSQASAPVHSRSIRAFDSSSLHSVKVITLQHIEDTQMHPIQIHYTKYVYVCIEIGAQFRTVRKTMACFVF